MPKPRRKRAENWTPDKKFHEARRLHLEEGWTQVAACQEVGLSRSSFGLRMKNLREEEAARAAQQAERDEAEKVRRATQGAGSIGLHPLGLQENRRVPATYEEFDRVYFGHLKCPDCEVRHEIPTFHSEIARAVAGKDPRVLVNLPPYHSKTTNISVKDTIHKSILNPNLRTIIVSKSLPFARLIVGSISEILTNEDLYEGAQRNLIEDWGPFKGDKVWNNTQLFFEGRQTAEKDATVQALGIGGQIYGRRADEIKFDDIVDVESSRNPDTVAKNLEWIDKDALSRIGKSGRAIFIGTRVAPGDIYYHLSQRTGYKVLRYPVILDDHLEETLWPEHFPYTQAMVHRGEMRPQDFQLIYQNIDIPGLGASFPPELVDTIKDSDRPHGHFESQWRMFAGLDPAGGNKDSGFTAMTLIGVDLATHRRYLINQVAVKAMKAPQMKDQMLAWSEQYPIYEWRVEGNGLQSQLVQYNDELIRELALRGTRVVPHTTNQNKWDPQFGVEAIAPLMQAGLYSIPWAGPQTAQYWQPLVEELISFPMGRTSDRVMSLWFAELGVRQTLARAHLPMFDSRTTKKWPNRVKRRRRVVDFHNQEVRPVQLSDQVAGHMGVGQMNQRRQTVGAPRPHGAPPVAPTPPGPSYVNTAGEVPVRDM